MNEQNECIMQVTMTSSTSSEGAKFNSAMPTNHGLNI